MRIGWTPFIASGENERQMEEYGVFDILLFVGIPFRLLYNRGGVSSQVLSILILDYIRLFGYEDITLLVPQA